MEVSTIPNETFELILHAAFVAKFGVEHALNMLERARILFFLLLDLSMPVCLDCLYGV